MSIHINTPKGADAAQKLIDHCINEANAQGLHGDVLLSIGTSLAHALAAHEPGARPAIALHLRNTADKIDGGDFAGIGQFEDYELVQSQPVH